MKKPAASPAQPELGPFQRTFTTDDPVAITEAFGLPKGTLSNGKIMGCAVRGLIDFYIVKLDEPYIHPQTGEMWRALSVPSNCLEALN